MGCVATRRSAKYKEQEVLDYTAIGMMSLDRIYPAETYSHILSPDGPESVILMPRSDKSQNPSRPVGRQHSREIVTVH